MSQKLAYFGISSLKYLDQNSTISYKILNLSFESYSWLIYVNITVGYCFFIILPQDYFQNFFNVMMNLPNHLPPFHHSLGIIFDQPAVFDTDLIKVSQVHLKVLSFFK